MSNKPVDVTAALAAGATITTEGQGGGGGSPTQWGTRSVSVMPIVPSTPMEMLGRALQMGSAPETLERLLALQERWERNAARKAYDAAIAAARAQVPTIIRERAVSHGVGKTAYKYADLAAIDAAVVKPLSEHGLTYRWRTEATDKAITVTCIVSHKDGHSEENSLTGPPEITGAKNPLQAIGSTVTYLQRYTLMAALGLAAAHDDDGTLAADPVLTADELDVVKAMLADAHCDEADMHRFNKTFKVSALDQLKRSQLETVKQRIAEHKREKQRAAKDA